MSAEGSLPAPERPLFELWLRSWQSVFSPQRWADALADIASPYAFNPLNVNPLRDHLVGVVDFAALRAGRLAKALRRRDQCAHRQGRDFSPRGS